MILVNSRKLWAGWNLSNVCLNRSFRTEMPQARRLRWRRVCLIISKLNVEMARGRMAPTNMHPRYEVCLEFRRERGEELFSYEYFILEWTSISCIQGRRIRYCM